MKQIHNDTILKIQDLANEVIADAGSGIPGLNITLANTQGTLLFNHSAGKFVSYSSSSSSYPQSPDILFWSTCYTKLCAAIIILQTIEKGLLSLDSSSDVEKWAPELQTISILKSINHTDGSLVLMPKTNRITLRILLTLTAGFDYRFTNENSFVSPAYRPVPRGSNPSSSRDSKKSVPGNNATVCGIGLDWALTVAARAEGKSVDQLLKTQLFDPLGFKKTYTQPPDRSSRHPVGYTGQSSSSLKNSNSAGHPVSASSSTNPVICIAPEEYVRIFAMLLNNGIYKPTNARILSEPSIIQLLTNIIPQWQNTERSQSTILYPNSSTLSHQHHQQLNPATAPPNRYIVDTVLWSDGPNFFYWIDTELELAGIVSVQYLPFGNAQILKLANDIKSAVYKDKLLAASK